MKLSKFYQNINLDFNIKSVTSNINKIQKNCIFVNLQNHSFFKIDDAIKDHIIIVSSSPILDKSIYSIVVPNIKAEYIRLMKTLYNLNINVPKLIGVLNDDFLNYEKVILDLYNNTTHDKISFINDFEDIDIIYNSIYNYQRRNIKYIFVLFHSSEILDFEDLLRFDYLILSKSSHTTFTKTLTSVDKLIRTNGIIIGNLDDFSDLSLQDNFIPFSFDTDSLYNIKNLTTHNKIITGELYKNKINLCEFLFCLTNYDYIYIIISLFILYDNEYQSINSAHIFFSKYIF